MCPRGKKKKEKRVTVPLKIVTGTAQMQEKKLLRHISGNLRTNANW